MRIPMFVLALLSFYTSYGQEKQNLIKELNFFGDIQIMADDASHRERAMESFNSLFHDYVHSESFSRSDLDNIKYISKITPSDNSFTLLSWRVMGEEKNHYFGYVVTDSEVIKLHNDDTMILDPSDSYSDKNWWGCLYYNILSVDSKNGTKHIVFGYNQEKKRQTKIVDVIQVDNGKVVFGAPLFENKKGGDDLNRIYITYGKNSNVTLNYNKGMTMIMHDHLVRGSSPSGTPTMLPDGSYVGYDWDGSRWIYIDKIYNQVSEKAPRPQPIFGKSEGTDLFGKRR